MSAVRLFVDEDAGKHAVMDGLRAPGIDVLTTIEANRCGAEDSDQLTFANWTAPLLASRLDVNA